LLPFVVLSCLSAILFLPIASNTLIPDVADLANHLIGIIQAKMAWAEGQVFLRTAPSGHYSSFRYPYFQFFSPTSYTVAAWMYRWITPSNPFLAYKVTIWAALLLGGVYIYRLAFWFVKSRFAAVLAAAVYLTAPYPIIVINYLGNLNEAISLGVIPLTVYYTLQRYYHPSNDKLLLQTALCWYLLATIHLVTFLYTSLILAIYLVTLTGFHFSQCRRLIHVGIAYVLGWMLAMWHLAPVALYYKYFFVSDNFSHNVITVGLGYLLSPVANFSEGLRTEYSRNIITQIDPSVGLPILLAVAVCSYWLVSRQAADKHLRYKVSCLLALFFLLFMMIWSPVNFWEWLPSSLGVIQYSWRLLGQTMWVGSLLFAWVVCWVFNGKLNAKYTILGLILIVLASSSWFAMPNRKFVHYDFIYKHSYELFNPDSYLVNYGKGGADKIDDLKLSALHIGSGRVDSPGLLKVGGYALVPQSIFTSAYAPELQIRGTIAEKESIKNQQLYFLANNQVVTTFALKPGDFDWNIPLDSLLKASGNVSAVLQFKMKNDKIRPLIHTDNILLTGFLNPKTTMTLAQIPSACEQMKGETRCRIAVPKGIQLLEIPVFYYPDMLNVTLNGYLVPYFSVLKGSFLIVGIIPLPGEVNVVNIQFRGLIWANYVSMVAWSLWGMLVLYLLLKTMMPVRREPLN
jgi:hypothetical protein